MKKSSAFWTLAVCLALAVLAAAAPRAVLAGASKVPFTADDTIEDTRRKIEQNNYHFTVKENWITRLSPEQRAAMRRRRPAEPRLPRRSPGIGPLAHFLSKPLPSSFDWRNYEGHSYVGPIRDQETCNSCYAFAAVSAAETAYNRAHGLTDSNTVDFSEAFVVWCLGNMPKYHSHFGGSCAAIADWDLMEMEAVVKEGLITEAQYPYDGPSTPSCSSAHWDYPREPGFKNWFRIPCGNVNAIKAAVRYFGAVNVAVVSQVTAFDGYSGGIYQDDTTDCDANPCYYAYTDHLVTLVGWDDNGDPDNNGYWILRNQWGTAWGESGYMRIKYTSARVSCEASYLIYHPGRPDSVIQLLIQNQ